MSTNDFKPFAIGAGANVVTQATYLALTALSKGFQSGKAASSQINKALRQSTFVASALMEVVRAQLSTDQLDDGNWSNAVANITAAIKGIGDSSITGEIKMGVFTTAPPGWFLLTEYHDCIGNAASGATRANADTWPLYQLIWNLPGSYVRTSSGGFILSKGSSALSDFNANRRLRFPVEFYGSVPGIAGTSDGTWTANPRSVGSATGEEKHALTAGENGPHTHTYTDVAYMEVSGAHLNGNRIGSGSTDDDNGMWFRKTDNSLTNNPSDPAINLPTTSSGAGNPHNTMQPTYFFQTIIKL